MGKIPISARVDWEEKRWFFVRVAAMKPKRTPSERLRQLIIADIKRGRRKGVK